MADDQWTIRVRLPNASAPKAFSVRAGDPVSVLEALVSSDPAVASSAAHGVTIMCGIPPKILGADATISSVLKNNEIAIARIRGASDVVSRAAPGESMLPSSDGKVIEVRSAAELKSLVAARPKVVVDFYADWCGPCKMIAPELDRLAKENPHVKVIKIDVDAEEDLAQALGIEAMPTFIKFIGGDKKDVVQGANKAALAGLFKP
uniref:Thioredoxin domain-containing protein n=1 Tax=Neobodo designis TaxID=312471 RepID=A0A7S1QTT2_NEODS